MKNPSLSSTRIRITFLKINTMNLNTPLFQLTVGEFMDLQHRTHAEEPIVKVEPKTERRFVYGLKGLSELFGCSVSTAQKIKNSGVIDKAITQLGRKITIDTELALELVRKSKVKHR